MLLETGRIVSIESQGLWVETIQRSACGSCQVQKGCGHSMLAKAGAASASRLWVLLEGRDASQYRVGNEVQIGVPEEVIAQGSLFVYTVPLLSMIEATVMAHHYLVSDGMTAICAAMGLFLGAAIVRWCSHLIRFDSRLQPVLIDAQTTAHSIQICALE
jgi:sigma-E factor negative regulatory protein RseC